MYFQVCYFCYQILKNVPQTYMLKYLHMEHTNVYILSNFRIDFIFLVTRCVFCDIIHYLLFVLLLCLKLCFYFLSITLVLSFCIDRVLIPSIHNSASSSLIARFLGPTWGPPGADRTQVSPMLATWTLLSGLLTFLYMSCSTYLSHTHILFPFFAKRWIFFYL